MNTETNHIIRLLTSLFKERERESVISQTYAKLTVDILRIESILQKRGIDTGKILGDLVETL